MVEKNKTEVNAQIFCLSFFATIANNCKFNNHKLLKNWHIDTKLNWNKFSAIIKRVFNFLDLRLFTYVLAISALS